MDRKKKKVLLNRAMFVERPLDSAELPVLTTLFHRFPEPGDYLVRVQRGERVLRRFVVLVVEEGGSQQHNLDLAAGPAGTPGCDPEPPEQYVLNQGGVMGFYASKGISQYDVLITAAGSMRKKLSSEPNDRSGEQPGENRGEKPVVLDSRKAIPAGDLFSVTLVREGRYRVTNLEGQAEAWISVRLPKDERYSMAHAELVEYSREGFKPPKVSILAGQSVVFRCADPARLRVEPQGQG